MKKTNLTLALASALFLSACDNNASQNAQAPLPVVSTQTVEVIPFQQSKSYIGRVEAVEDTNITAQITGYLAEKNFSAGQMVEKGQLLFTIEPSSFEAQVASAKASLAQANASLKKADLDFKRAESLLPKGSISQSNFDDKYAQLLSARAQVESATAQLKLAEVNLSYTEIRAPFDGRISDSNVSKGDLLSPSTSVLTTLVSLDPVHASFSISERERLNLGIDKISETDSQTSRQIEVGILLESGQEFEHSGVVDYLGNRIDLNTGTMAMRAIVSNPMHRLLPGQHIRVELRESEPQDVVVIPRKAVQTDLEGDFVMVVSEGNVAERRNVTLGKQTDQGVVVNQGISESDTVITAGLQRVRNGNPVNVKNQE
ncbi:efflux RND transporter periplasmic adaptor subunit [Vibrio sonorensis]|uniref:efflux RND transporter periplasmic adaptor subunit n=1 Tax=Vibrio sonorensis TaxID=1004316 RepID=UPI0008D8F073|nr:efflux RND transporter periplasmic adaptor subunit [Vibrio sonorensis]